MKTRSSHPFALSVLALAALALALPARAEDKPAAAPQMSDADMQAMMKSMMPGPQHQHLARMAGDWTFTNNLWMAPGQPPTTSEGTMHAEMMLGGRYLEEHWMGTMMGQPFEGRGTDAYDNVTQRYEGSWIDNMGTGIMTSSGTCDDTGKVCNFTAEASDPAKGGKTTVREVLTWVDDNTFSFAMYGAGPDGKDMKMMEIVAKRKM